MISLRKHYEAMRAADLRALEVARDDIDRRLDGMNALREQINSERGDYVQAAAYEARHQALINLINVNTERLGALEKVMANVQGRFAAGGILVGMLSAAIGVVVARLLSG